MQFARVKDEYKSRVYKVSTNEVQFLFIIKTPGKDWRVAFFDFYNQSLKLLGASSEKSSIHKLFYLCSLTPQQSYGECASGIQINSEYLHHFPCIGIIICN
jgi:hypothetical protein